MRAGHLLAEKKNEIVDLNHMQTKRSSIMTFHAPLLLHDPMTGESKINTSKWSCFLYDIYGESKGYRDFLDRATSDKKRVNEEYEKSRKLTFNAIHNISVQRRPIRTANPVPRLSRQAQRKKAVKKEYDPFEFETAPKNNHLKWPKRASSAARTLRPAKLEQIYKVEKRHMDTYVVTGEQVSEYDI